MNETLKTLTQKKHKDALPSDTVSKIQDILSRMGIECEEFWAKENEIGTYSLRLNLKGTSIGSNGKGMTREFARASAYAEFMERIQNNKVVANSTMNNVLCDKHSPFYLFPDETLRSAEELLAENNSFLQLFFQTRTAVELGAVEDRAALLNRYQKLDYNIHRRKDRFICVPYYSMKAGKTVEIPYTLQNMFYGSNGMCAGNSRDEALVQGMSEIVERYIQTRIIMEQKSLPDIPESYLSSFDDIYEMYKAVKASDSYEILLKDGSLGGRYPACVLILLEKNTGWYGVKVGAHPDYRIALERLFTEATQGIELGNFAHKARFDFSNDGVSTQINLQNSYKTGDAKYPYQLFSGTSEYDFVEPRDFSNSTNRDMLDYLTGILSDCGRDILIHDVSYLGFPSYHIIVPGLSEMNRPSKNDFEADNTRFHVQKLIGRPDMITPDNIRYLTSVIGFYQYSLQSNTLKDFSGCMSDTDFPASEFSLDMLYFKTMCYLFQKDYSGAKATHDAFCLIARQTTWYRVEDYYFAVQNYINGMMQLKDHSAVMEHLKHIYDPAICTQLDHNFREPEKILLRQYPVSPENTTSFAYRELIRLHESYNRE